MVGIALVYGLTIALSAFLMFVIEPFVAKLFLPSLGGGPNVWNTCVIFFQLMLLAGYMYAHAVSTKLAKPACQACLHVFIVWLSLLVLPIAAPTAVPGEGHPAMWLLYSLALIVGPPFFAISTTAPLLQSWYSRSGGHGSSDPYFLYAASNFGGLIGLLAYPLLLEPNLRISEQAGLIRNGYVCFAVLISVCALLLYAKKGAVDASAGKSETPPPSRNDYAIWIGLAMIPASLFLGLTSYVTSQLSSIPLFWMIPMAIYLVSFVIAFGRMPDLVVKSIIKLAPVSVLLAVLPLTSQSMPVVLFGAGGYVTTGLSLHVIALFFICTACHGMLAARRPLNMDHLTRYYLCLSIGGLFGSCFNTFVAPLLFKGPDEYSVVLMLAGIVLATLPLFRRQENINRLRIVVIPLVVCAVCAIGFVLTSGHTTEQSWSQAPGVPVLQTSFDFLLRYGLPFAICVLLSTNNLQLRLGLIVVAVFVFVGLNQHEKGIFHKTRNFFACLRLEEDTHSNTVVLWNGISPHGAEYLDPAMRGKPVFYFYPDGPIGSLYDELYSSEDAPAKPMAVMGLGAGTASSLAKPGQTLVFYEINPQVVELAENPFYFTFLLQARNRKVDLRTVIGDGRLEIQRAPYKFYKLIIADVYSSSAIPTHMLTREAIEIYLQKLTADGALAFNVTNGYYNLKPVLARAASELGLTALTAQEADRSVNDQEPSAIDWVMFSRDEKLLDSLKQKGWQPLAPADPKFRLWTDDYCNPLGVLEAQFS